MTTSLSLPPALRSRTALFSGLAFAGVILLVCMANLLSWAEGRAIVSLKTLAEGPGIVAEAFPGPLDPGKDGRLIHISGTLASPETLSDPSFAVQTRGLRLLRKVESYQWVEVSDTAGGAPTYRTEWHEGWVDPAKFAAPDGHQNPEPAFVSQRFGTATVRLGSLLLSQAMIDRLPDSGVALPLSPEEAQTLQFASGIDSAVHVDDNGAALFTVDPQNPRVGDLRVSFMLVPMPAISVIAMQKGDKFAPYPTPGGNYLQLMMLGEVSAGDMFGPLDLMPGSALDNHRLVAAGGTLLGVLLLLPLLARFGPLQAGLSLLAGGVVFFAAVEAIAWRDYRPEVASQATGIAFGAVLAAAALIAAWIWWQRQGRHRLRTVAPPTAPAE